MGSGFRARILRVTAEAVSGRVGIDYQVDDSPPARLSMPLPIGETQAVDLLITATAIYLGSLALAEQVRLEYPVDRGITREFGAVTEMIYDIRRWRDNLPLAGPPRIDVTRSAESAPKSRRSLDPRRVALLWSGGKDSTFSLLSLRANGYDVAPLHMTVNDGVVAPELRAVSRLAETLAVDNVQYLQIDHPDFREMSARYADAWDRFPHNNRVPFGRDLVLYALALPYAISIGAGAIAFGHERECRHAEVTHRGKRIPRNDVESVAATNVLQRVFRRYAHPDLTILLPVAGLSELRILRDMLVNLPDLVAETSFCFWGRNCGRCAKCLRYFLAQRVYGDAGLEFATNPLATGACPELDELLGDPALLFHNEVVLMLARLVQRGDVRNGEGALQRFARERYAEVEPRLEGLEHDLMSVHRHDPQLPTGFRQVAVLDSRPPSLASLHLAMGA